MRFLFPQRHSSFLSGQTHLSLHAKLCQLALSLGFVGLSLLNPVKPGFAQSANLSEAELKTLLNQIDTAASQRDLPTTLNFYHPNFTTTDGLDRTAFSQALTQFWKRFQTLEYRTQLLSWKQDQGQITAETQTTITGTELKGDRTLKLSATLTSRQIFSNRQLLRQDLLTEKSQLQTGDTPPMVTVSLPEQVKPSQEFTFDAILQEPLRQNLVLAGAIETSAATQAYLNPEDTSKVKLEVLSAGGLFKLGDTKDLNNDFWISSLFIREDGISIITQRVNLDPS